MRLAHIPLRGTTSYLCASAIQECLVKQFLAAKSNPDTQPPDPTIITAQFRPVYTCGRREIGHVSEQQRGHLLAGGRAEFHEAMRGGQTTFHGPGQLTAYPILDLLSFTGLRPPLAPRLTPRSYVCLLEKATIRTCARWDIRAMTTEHTGVWVTQDRKIASIGVHMRRNITSHGVGLNVSTDLWWFDRIVACGLEGKRTTNFRAEGAGDVGVEAVGEAFVGEMATLLGIGEVYTVEPPAVESPG